MKALLLPGSDEEQENMLDCETEGELIDIDSLVNLIKDKLSNEGRQKTRLERLKQSSDSPKFSNCLVSHEVQFRIN